MVGARNYCCSSGCKNTRGKHPRMLFASFPMAEHDVERCRQWIKNMKKTDVYCVADHEKLSPEEKAKSINTRNLYLCEAHFTDDQFLKPKDKGFKKLQRQLTETAVPTIFPRSPPRIRPLPFYVPLPPFVPRKQKLQTAPAEGTPTSTTAISSRIPPPSERLHLVDHPYSCPFRKVPSDDEGAGPSAEPIEKPPPPEDPPAEKALKQRIKILSGELKRMSALFGKQRRINRDLERKVTKLKRFAPSSSLKKNLVEASAKFMTTAGLEIYKHQISNHGKAGCGRRYTPELRDIALPLYKESPPAYKMWSEIFVLPCYSHKSLGNVQSKDSTMMSLDNLQDTLDEVVSRWSEKEQNLQDTLDDVVSRMSESEQETVIETDEVPRFENIFLMDGVVYLTNGDVGSLTNGDVGTRAVTSDRDILRVLYKQ